MSGSWHIRNGRTNRLSQRHLHLLRLGAIQDLLSHVDKPRDRRKTHIHTSAHLDLPLIYPSADNFGGGLRGGGCLGAADVGHQPSSCDSCVTIVGKVRIWEALE